MLEKINSFIWGAPALFMILAVGFYLTLGSGFSQISLFGCAVKLFFRKFLDKKNGDSPYRSLCTALAATVGTGNIIGVAGAIVIGGPGSIFWMWVCGLLGMALKFAEATLAVQYRTKNKQGEWVAGPMYMIQNGLKKRWHWLSFVYCLFGVIASFGVGNAAQVNAVVESVIPLFSNSKIPPIQISYLIGVILAVFCGSVLLGGAKRIGQMAELIVPVAAVGYVLLCLIVLTISWKQIPSAFSAIVVGAVSPKAVTGGMLGSAFLSLKTGASRGTFTNEAGMGTASIAHGMADVKHPVQQGLMGVLEVFIDTILICTLTALVILCSGIRIPYGTSDGATLTIDAFAHSLGNWVNVPLSIAVCLFAVATILGWSLYGIRCAQYLFGEAAWRVYVFAQIVIIAISALIDTEPIWLFSEALNGLMLLPNLVAILLLSPVFMQLLKEFKVIRKNSLVNLTNTYKKW